MPGQSLGSASPLPLTLRRAARPWVRLPIVLSLAMSVLLSAYLASGPGWRLALLFAIGLFAGIVLYHAAFGFTTAWRVFFTQGFSAGLRAQMLMVTLATAGFVLIGSLPRPLLGLAPQFWVAPLSLSVVVGAFLFGVGMQLGGGCGSGTLYTAGGGNLRMMVTLAAFVLGSLLGTYHAPLWDPAPSLPPVSLIASFGPLVALVFTAVLSGGIASWAMWRERARYGRLAPITRTLSGVHSVLRGPWPLLWGALGLAFVNVATLVVAGRPWGITSAFALWGAKLARVAGLEVSSWPYWADPQRSFALSQPVLADVTSVMDIGILLGALLAAGLAGSFSPLRRFSLQSLAAALIGGLLLGYGARISFGCNIGAFFSGVASTSLHGWLWLVAAMIGNALGTRLRPWFGLSLERTQTPLG